MPRYIFQYQTVSIYKAYIRRTGIATHKYVSSYVHLGHHLSSFCFRFTVPKAQLIRWHLGAYELRLSHHLHGDEARHRRTDPVQPGHVVGRASRANCRGAQRCTCFNIDTAVSKHIGVEIQV